MFSAFTCPARRISAAVKATGRPVRAAKRAASDAYVQGLLDNGGPSTDIFVDMLGKEKTTEYFKKYIFGTE